VFELIQEARAKSVPLLINYDGKVTWQKVTFEALRVFVKHDGLLEPARTIAMSDPTETQAQLKPRADAPERATVRPAWCWSSRRRGDGGAHPPRRAGARHHRRRVIADQHHVAQTCQRRPRRQALDRCA
jgi:hypothetical protein